MPSQKVSVILLEDVPSLGQAGDIVSVSEGYARNALFPPGKAALASAGIKKEHEARRQTAQKKEADALAARQAKAAQLEGTELALYARVKDGNEIFGRLTAAHIAKQLNAQAKLELKSKDVLLPEPLTKLGSYDVTLCLAPDVEASIKVTVLPEPGSGSKPKDDE